MCARARGCTRTHITHTLMWLIQLIERHVHSRRGVEWREGQMQRLRLQHISKSIWWFSVVTQRDRHAHCETSIDDRLPSTLSRDIRMFLCIYSLFRVSSSHILWYVVDMFCTSYPAVSLATHFVFHPIFEVRVWKLPPLRRTDWNMHTGWPKRAPIQMFNDV